MDKEMTKLRDIPTHKENPFLSKLVIPVKSKTQAVATSRTDAIINTVTGEMKEESLFLASKKMVDREAFVKIFVGSIAAMYGLSKAGQKLFFYVASLTQFGDRVIFNDDDCKKFTGYNSHNSINTGLIELLENQFIAKTDTANVYFVNPQIFYKGDRIVLVTEYRKKKYKKEIDQNQIDMFNSLQDKMDKK